MAQFTAYGRLFESLAGISTATEVWLKDSTINELLEESRAVTMDGRKMTLNFGPATERVIVEIGNSKFDGALVSYIKVLNAGTYNMPQGVMARRGNVKIL